MAIENFAISPDGRMVAFQYKDGESGFHGLGLFEWETGKLSPIPRALGTHLGNASFSPDGKRLLAMTSTAGSGQIVSIDLATSRMTELAQARRGWQAPVFQPGTDNVLVVVGGPGIYYHLKLLNLKDGTETTILEEKVGFKVSLFTPSFVGANEIIFQAIAPADPQLRQAVLDLVPNDTETIAYRLEFGGRPEIILADVTANKVSPNERGASSVSASNDGKTLAFIAHSRSEPYNEAGAYNYEVFTLKDGMLKQMTDLRSYMSLAKVSYDGSTIVFSSVPNRHVRSNPRFGGLNPLLLDLRTGKVTPTHLLEALQQRSDFKLP